MSVISMEMVHVSRLKEKCENKMGRGGRREEGRSNM